MKKLLIIVAALAIIFCFAACNKNSGGVYEPPMTEVVTFEDGVTAVFEVVTEKNGEVATDAEGETMYIPYVPPVTEKGGYLVTDAQGSTIPSRPDTTLPDGYVAPTDKAEENDVGGFADTTTKPAANNEKDTTKNNGVTQQAETTTKKNNVTTEQSTTKKPEKTTAAPNYDEPTSAIDGELTPAKAAKLVNIMKSVENPFEDCLVEGDFYGAEKAIDTYIDNIRKAVNEIKADKALYEFIGNEQLDKWLNSMLEAKDYYAIYMTMVRQEDKTGERNPLFYKAYTDFQGYYRSSLESYYFILYAGQDRA